MKASAFQSDDRHLAVMMDAPIAHAIPNEASRGHGARTVGILVERGTMQLEMDVMPGACPPHANSRSCRFPSSRGVSARREVLVRLWNRPVSTYFLGEWHVHQRYGAAQRMTDNAAMHSRTRREAFKGEVPVPHICGPGPTKWLVSHAIA